MKVQMAAGKKSLKRWASRRGRRGVDNSKVGIQYQCRVNKENWKREPGA